jgi:hypothetical protein
MSKSFFDNIFTRPNKVEQINSVTICDNDPKRSKDEEKYCILNTTDKQRVRENKNVKVSDHMRVKASE